MNRPVHILVRLSRRHAVATCVDVCVHAARHDRDERAEEVCAGTTCELEFRDRGQGAETLSEGGGDVVCWRNG